MFVASTNKTPQIDLDVENGILQIKGISIPEDANDFLSIAGYMTSPAVVRAASFRKFRRFS